MSRNTHFGQKSYVVHPNSAYVRLASETKKSHSSETHYCTATNLVTVSILFSNHKIRNKFISSLMSILLVHVRWRLNKFEFIDICALVLFHAHTEFTDLHEILLIKSIDYSYFITWTI